jgi:DNA-binding response OmpR family regulator
MSTRVLLVDDEREFADYTAKRLSARGMQVQVRYDGVSALEYVSQRPIDVVVLDLLMPGMDGFEVFRNIKKVRPQVRVIMLSGHMDDSAVLEGTEMGVADYILKPCEFSVLLEAIRNVGSPGAH